jgi:hypothetical protein
VVISNAPRGAARITKIELVEKSKTAATASKIPSLGEDAPASRDGAADLVLAVSVTDGSISLPVSTWHQNPVVPGSTYASTMLKAMSKLRIQKTTFRQSRRRAFRCAMLRYST